MKDRHLGRQPGGLREIPGFASPPRDGFAFGFNRSSRVDIAAHRGRYMAGPSVQMANPYGVGSVRASTDGGGTPTPAGEGPMTFVWGSWAGVSGTGGSRRRRTVLEVLRATIRAKRR